MPQPITHLLVERRALQGLLGYFLNQQDIDREEFTSFGDDLFYSKDLIRHTHQLKYGVVSDVMHWDGSYDRFCSGLDHVKSNPTGDENRNRSLKFDLYREHIHGIADLVFHPFVYRAAKDHWQYHPDHAYHGHKVIESIIDSYLLKELEGIDPYEFRRSDHAAHPRRSERTIDDDLFKLLNKGIREAYRDTGIFAAHGIDYEQYFGRYQDNDPQHPIKDAYKDFIFYTEMLFALHEPLRHIPGLECLVPLKKISDEQRRLMNEDQKVWYNSQDPDMPRYSVLELFKFAVTASKMMIEASERFLASDFASAKDFFAKHAQDVPYLGQNFNLDTGLPSGENKNLTRLASLDEILRYGVGNIAANYRSIENNL